MIRNKYAHGVTVSELADEYYLSLDSIKKILYTRKNDRPLTYAPTTESAVQYANAGMIEEWVQSYMQLTNGTSPASSALPDERSLYFGVVKFPLRLIQREEGGEEDGQTSGDPTPAPPLLVRYKDGKFRCDVRKDLLASLRQRKINAYPTIIVLHGNAEYTRFMKHYGNIFFYI